MSIFEDLGVRLSTLGVWRFLICTEVVFALRVDYWTRNHRGSYGLLASALAQTLNNQITLNNTEITPNEVIGSNEINNLQPKSLNHPYTAASGGLSLPDPLPPSGDTSILSEP